MEYVANIVGQCVYKGVLYGQDQRWEDGCELNCVCTDAMQGLYQCTDKWVCDYTVNLESYCKSKSKGTWIEQKI